MVLTHPSSGAPTESQTYHYARTVLDLMLRAPITEQGMFMSYYREIETDSDAHVS
jgi:hypothetical protein